MSAKAKTFYRSVLLGIGLLVVGVAINGCSEELDIDNITFHCDSEADCEPGYRCKHTEQAERKVCVSQEQSDAEVGDIGDTSGADAPDAGDARDSSHAPDADASLDGSDGDTDDGSDGSVDAPDADTADANSCANPCVSEAPNTSAACVDGRCQTTCLEDWYDADGNGSNGCECSKSNGGVEACDGVDNDCNGQVDEGGVCSSGCSGLGDQSGAAVQSIAVSEYHSCAAVSSGDVYCWGQNANGEVGDGTTMKRYVPTASTTSQSFEHIAAGGATDMSNAPLGSFYTCGVTSADDMYCWGANGQGQLGDSTTTEHHTPVAVSASESFEFVRNGFEHTCAITTSDDGLCWGNNSSGQLGIGSTTQKSVPTSVSGNHSWAMIDPGGQHTCGITTSGQAYCWGDNTDGQLGDGTTTSYDSPNPISGMVFQSIGAGKSFSCGITSAGEAYCWGANGEGQLGDNTLTRRSSPTKVQKQSSLTFTDISVGWEHVCAVTTSNEVYCWGENGFGQLGNGANSDRRSPQLVEGGLSFASVSAGNRHTCGLTTSGLAYCWGYNVDGQLGNGSSAPTTSHVPVQPNCP